MSKIAWRTLAAAHLILGFYFGVAPAIAQSVEERRACGPDVMRLCREFVPNKELIDKCLMEKKAELSAACRTVMIGPETSAPPVIPAKQPAVAPPAKPKLSTPAKPKVVMQTKQKSSSDCEDDDDDDDDDDD